MATKKETKRYSTTEIKVYRKSYGRSVVDFDTLDEAVEFVLKEQEAHPRSKWFNPLVLDIKTRQSINALNYQKFEKRKEKAISDFFKLKEQEGTFIKTTVENLKIVANYFYYNWERINELPLLSCGSYYSVDFHFCRETKVVVITLSEPIYHFANDEERKKYEGVTKFSFGINCECLRGTNQIF